MLVLCHECKNFNYLNCIDTVEITCRLKHIMKFEKHECKDYNSIKISSSENYRRGYLHGYNQCRNDILKSVKDCMPDIPKEMKNLE